ncbi:DNA polymerase [Erythrobacter longus]|uniref:DNA polymerase I n=1 Tax=Erythrobacter longus TaxID=1044 RepID=A0A074M546_ERYLO|nr:DNA polymerase I [Erythrobacter longus]KEO89821.1 DNA polymerase [Erythrobacter longus]
MSDKKQHLYLVDGSAYIFRAYHRLPPLTNPQGTPVGAVYGYTTMLWKLADDLDAADGPTHLAVILDKDSKSFRNDIYPEYKANRPPPPEDLRPQFPLIRDATRAFSLPCIEEQGLEADDLIASYAREAQRKGWDVTIVSSDKDLMQLVGEENGANGSGRIDMLDTMKSQRIYLDEVHEKFGVTPDLVGDVLALMGDSVDNIPGIYGVGPKTATKLIAEHGSLTAALDSAPDMKKSKLKERLLEGREAAELSRVLVTLKEDCDLPVAIEDMALGKIPEGPLVEFLQTHGFTSLLKRLGAGTGSPERANNLNPAKADKNGDKGSVEGNRQPLSEMPQVDRSAYETVQTLERLQEWTRRATAARLVAVDTETSSLDAMQADLVGVSLALGPNDACYIPLAHGGTDLLAEKPDQVAMADAIAALKPMLEDDAVLKVFQNGKYDLNVLERSGISVSPIEDTMVMSFDLDAGRGEGMSAKGIGGHGMDELSERHLGHTPLSFKEICGTGKKAIPFGEVPLGRATEYAAEDADVTLRLYRMLKPRLSEEGGTSIYERVDRPLIPVVAAMEREGIKVDRARLAKLSEEFAGETARLEKEIHEVAGEEFSVGSPKQLGEILFEKMGFKGGRKGKSGAYSTDHATLEKLSSDPEAAAITKKVLEWRHLSKLKSTYTDALQAQINPYTGRVHTSYSLVGAQTGRLSSTDPNLQNIPIRTPIGRQIREAFVPEDGNVLLAADYSQIELRLAAHMADVGTLKEAFANGEDIHSRTATEMFGEVTRDTRARAKTINFAILYGISRWGLAGRLEVEPDEAQAMIDTYFQRFPGIQRYISETLTSVGERGYSETLFGRKTWFPRIKSKNQAERQGSERAAINAPIQGTSADIIKRAMARMLPALRDAGLKDVRMLLQVHDELVFELPERDVAAASPIIERVMAEAALPSVTLDVPLAIDIGTGASWDAAH